MRTSAISAPTSLRCRPPKASATDDHPDLSKKGAQAAAGRRCASCHTDTFAGTKAVAHLRVGGGVAAMADVAYALSDEGIEALAHYFANL
jgi:hypothetical protein